jgi:transcriptional adapter 3
MAPASGQKGTGKKNNAISMQKSRNSTPAPTSSLPPQEFYDPDYLATRVILFQNLSYDDLVDQGASNATVPDSKSIDAMLEKLKSLTNIMERRSTFYDRGMRFLADERKKRPDDYDAARADGEPEKRIRKRDRKKGSDSLAPPEGGNIGMIQ